jgi:capsular polysaccharide biosynthesis protein
MPMSATVRVERLFVPWTVTADLFPHPCISEYFRRLTKTASAHPGTWPGRIYIDRRAGPNRRLANEDDVVIALERMGFTCVRLEAMRLAEQIALFGNAEIIVAPHGAGLANLVHAQPGCGLIELHMDTYANWCFRRLAAVCQVSYDCVIGRQIASTVLGSVHAQQWAVSVTHMLGAVEQMLSAPR